MNGIAEVALRGTVLGVHTVKHTANGKSDTKIVNIVPDTSNAQVTLNIPAQQVVTNNSDGDAADRSDGEKIRKSDHRWRIAVNFTMHLRTWRGKTLPLKITVLPSLRPMAKRMSPSKRVAGTQPRLPQRWDLTQ
ncbi:hypothetical protein ACVPSA_18075 [Salmonella enterica subsp. enterica serovar Enteritidis]